MSFISSINFKKQKNVRKNLGIKVKDQISGLEGVVTAQCSYLNGSDRVLVTPVINEQGECKEEWFDIARVNPVK